MVPCPPSGFLVREAVSELKTVSEQRRSEEGRGQGAGQESGEAHLGWHRPLPRAGLWSPISQLDCWCEFLLLASCRPWAPERAGRPC